MARAWFVGLSLLVSSFILGTPAFARSVASKAKVSGSVFVCEGHCSRRSSQSASATLTPVEAMGGSFSDAFQMMLLSCPAERGKIVGVLPDRSSPPSFFVPANTNAEFLQKETLDRFCRQE